MSTAIEALRSFAVSEALRSFAASHGVNEHAHLAAFANMCTSALNGEAWAVERLADVVADLTFEGRDATPVDVQAERVLRIILATDVTSPDGSI